MAVMMGFAAALMAAAQAAPAPAAGASPTVQSLFDAAAGASRQGDDARAVALYEQLEARLATGNSRRSLAIVRMRKGFALINLSRVEEGLAALDRALPDIPATDESLAGDRGEAIVLLARDAEVQLDYARGAQLYTALLDTARVDDQRIVATAGLARTLMFSDPAAALRHAEQALSIVEARTDAKPELLAAYRTLKGRVLLNLGRFAEARQILDQALKELGGLTRKVTYSDIVARSDVAIAALLAGDPNDARRYLAYTGAGTAGGEQLRPSSYELPECGGADGLKPDDVVVIQFNANDDGTVSGVMPVYASRGGAALPFARKVTEWSWLPDQVAKVDPFFRLALRYELRCTAGNQAPGVKGVAHGALLDWLSARGVAETGVAARTDAAALGLLRAELGRRIAQSGEGALATVGLLVALLSNPNLPAAEAVDIAERIQAILRREGAPPLALAAIGLRISELSGRSGKKSVRSFQAARIAELRSLAGNAEIASDARALAAVRIALSDALRSRRQVPEALSMVRAITTDQRLLRLDPLRVGALVRLASLEAGTGQLDAARDAYAETGLTEQQCALVDARQAVRKSNVSGMDFPQEALRWGFSGWASVEHDIAADGRPQNMRTVAAYPAFTFGDASQKAVGGFEFEQAYRPSGGLGCSAASQTMRFITSK